MSHVDDLAENEFLFTSESVTEGHPDKMSDQVSDAVLDAILSKGDPLHDRSAVETLFNTGLCVVTGEIRTEAQLDIPTIARETIDKIGYNDARFGFDSNTCSIMVALDHQSEHIAQGVDGDEPESAGAGDQGMMFGYASNETEALMPMPIQIAHRLAEKLSAVRKDGTLEYLRPDGKTQVTVRYRDGKPVRVEKLLISTQHAEGVDQGQIKDDLWDNVITPILGGEYADLWDESTLKDEFLVNPTGIFVIGGPMGDAGLTGRKIIVDTYGGAARHGGGAFSGKDPSKVDRSAAYATRYVAKNIVAAGLADRCEVQVAYAIGVSEPISLMVNAFDTSELSERRLTELVREHFDLRPGAFRQYLDLHRPIYSPTAAYGHFGREGEDFTWEKTDRAEALREAAGI